MAFMKKQESREDLKDKPIPKGAHLLEVKDLRMFFHTKDGVVKAVNDVSYTLDKGETLGVVGESGSGKSVTAMTIMGLIEMPPGKIEGGDILYRGESLLDKSEKELQAIRGNDIAMIFQDPMTSLNPVYTVGRQLGEGLRVHRGYSKREALARAVELLHMVGIPNAEQRVKEYPHQFSGGMRQRAMIAMALACDPDILIADEPTTALDVTIQAQIVELMQEIQAKNNNAIIMITHDLGVVANMADKIMVMYAGRPVEFGTADDIFYNPLHPYTWGLMRSIPEPDMYEKKPLKPIDGNPPSLVHLPSGCSFHPRCPYATELCRNELPPLYETKSGHYARCHYAGDAEFIRKNAPVNPRSLEEAEEQTQVKKGPKRAAGVKRSSATNRGAGPKKTAGTRAASTKARTQRSSSVKNRSSRAVSSKAAASSSASSKTRTSKTVTPKTTATKKPTATRRLAANKAASKKAK